MCDTTGEDIGHNGAEVALNIHTFVFVEAAVLDGDDGVFHGLRDGFGRDFEPALLIHPCDGVVAVVQNRRNARCRTIREVLEVGLHCVVCTVDGHASNSGHRGERECTYHAAGDRC
ncbi:hypothetical protein FRC0084_00201 [Corynebacterium diphtheriae]|nr:hypothetical protein FRC0084_00201 [Corynebacterium diphtheriae]